jgi:hypothetical protein
VNEERTHHAFSDDALGDCDAVGLAERIERGEVTARELVAAAIARAEKVEPVLHAIAAECFERALDAAEPPSSGFFSAFRPSSRTTLPLPAWRRITARQQSIRSRRASTGLTLCNTWRRVSSASARAHFPSSV